MKHWRTDRGVAQGVDIRNQFLAAASQCRYDYGTPQWVHDTMIPEIGKRKQFYWYAFYAPIKQGRFLGPRLGPCTGAAIPVLAMTEERQSLLRNQVNQALA